MSRNQYAFFLLCILIGSCARTNLSTDLSVIPVESMVGKYEILNISDYASSVSYIPLETNDNVLIRNISEIIFEQEQIIVNDPIQSCMVFDKYGSYLHNLGNKGLGPEEYLSIRYLSSWNDSIFLHTGSPVKIMIYHSDGRLIDILRADNIPETYRLNAIWFLKPQIYLSDVVAMAENNSTSSYPRAILLQEDNKRLTISREYPYVSLEKEFGGFSSSFEVATMYRFSNKIYTYKAINDTIFTIGPDLEMDKAFVFNLGKYRASTKWMFEMNPKKNPDYIWPLNIMESTDYLFVEFFFGNHAPERFEYLSRPGTGDERVYTDYRVFGIFNKRTGQLKLMNQPVKKKLGFKNDIDNGPVIWPHYISSNNELVTYISPEDFMEYYEKTENHSPRMTEIAKNLKIDDNPIVIIAKFKK